MSLLLVPLVLAAAGPAPASSAPASGFDPAIMDTSVDPCSDFFQYVCGGWMKAHPIPADQSRWGTFELLSESNLDVLHGILEDAARTKHRDADTRKIGDFYASCMDEKTIDKKGLSPLEPELARIAALRDKAALPALLAHLHGEGSLALFTFGSRPDMKSSTVYIAATDQRGLGLPERDYYLRTDPKSVELRDRYVKHVARMLELADERPAAAAAGAKAVLELETELARASLDMVSRRNPNNLYHKMTVGELQALSPAFDWNGYFASASAAPRFDSLNVAVPDFVKALDGIVARTSLADLKTYLRWHELHAAAPYLSDRFVREDFEFYGKALTGAKQMKPRWKRCVEQTDRAIGEALGRAFVAKKFGPEAKERAVSMVTAIEDAFRRDIAGLEWMSDATKKQAETKLAAIRNKIGYPDEWRDYGKLEIRRGDHLGNAMRAIAFENDRRLRKIGTPVDPTEWFMTPPTVNAYYNPSENNINFPAGILQPPFFTATADDAINFGGIGAVMGHEMSHGFDDSGRRFDAQGNLRDWWTADDARRFTERAQCLVNEYGGFVAVDDVKLNGKLTLGENTADNGGLRLALMALQDRLAGKTQASIDGFTPEQRVFLGYGQVWCQNVTPEASRMRAQTDPHSPGRYRVDGTVSNMPEFARAFGCKAGAPMVREPRCRVW